MRLIFIILFVVIAQSVVAQGYRGKRFSLSYQHGYSYIGYHVSSKPIKHNKLDLGIVFQNATINLTGQYATLFVDDYYSPSHSSSRDDVPEGFGDLHVQDVLGGFQINFYRKDKGAYAPFGRYIGVGIELGYANTYKSSLHTYAINYAPYYRTFTIGTYNSERKTSITVVSLYLGRNILLMERMLIGYGIQIGYEDPSVNDPKWRYMGKPYFNLGFIF